MALTKSAREERRRRVEFLLRRRLTGRRVELTLQDGRRRPRVTGRVDYVATSGAYALLVDDDRPAEKWESGALHVPLERVVRVRDVDPRKRDHLWVRVDTRRTWDYAPHA